MLKRTPELEAARLLATVLANFSAISFGVGIYDNNQWGIVLGFYSLFFALVIAWRSAE